MAAVDYLGSQRKNWVENNSIAPSRKINYIKKKSKDDEQTYPDLDCLVGAGTYNKSEKDKISSMEIFGSLELGFEPSTYDFISFNSIEFKVKRWTKLGDRYTIYAEKTGKTAWN